LPIRLLKDIADQKLDVKNQYLGTTWVLLFSDWDVFIIHGFTFTVFINFIFATILGAPP